MNEREYRSVMKFEIRQALLSDGRGLLYKSTIEGAKDYYGEEVASRLAKCIRFHAGNTSRAEKRRLGSRWGIRIV